ncbi:MAG TPA: hypothetical protein VE135_15820 [Pyrinomonadaceae bacterium]|nr:hypothetical protein [Pyrinomonadaceae bacterium]
MFSWILVQFALGARASRPHPTEAWERGRLARVPRKIDQIAGETPALPGQTELYLFRVISWMMS